MRAVVRNFILFGGVASSPNADAFNRADGDVGNGWLYSAGKWTIASGKLVANPTIGSDLITNGGAETGDPPTGWTLISGAVLSQVTDNRPGSSGTKAIQVARGTISTSVSKNDTLTAKRWYRMAAWIKNGTATDWAVQLGDSGNWKKITAATWTQMFGLGYPSTTTLNIQGFATGASSVTGLIDDYTAFLLTTADLFCVRDMGTPNTRFGIEVTLGNYAAGVVVCLDSISNPQNYILAMPVPYDNALGNVPRFQLSKFVAGTRTDLGATPSSGIAYSAGAKLELEYMSGVVRMYYGGQQLDTDVQVKDAAFATATLHGVFASENGAGLDNTTYTNSATLSLNGDIDAIFSVGTSAANLWSTSGADDWLGRATLAKDGSKWYAVYRSSTTHSVAASKYHIRFSSDEGATWSTEDQTLAPAAVTNAPFLPHGSNTDTGDGIVIVAPNGDIIVQVGERASATGGTYQWRSTAASAGAAFTDEGKINSNALLYGGQDYTIDGSDIYLVLMECVTANGDYPYLPTCYKSSNNGTTWTRQGQIESDTGYGNECSIQSLGSGHFVAVMRAGDVSVSTYIFHSYDYGVTWTARAVIADMGLVARPRIKAFMDGYLLFGRQEIGAVDRTVVYYTRDFVTFGRKFYPDSSATFSDTGYCDVLQKTNNDFYMLSYGGTTATASVRSMVFTITA